VEGGAAESLLGLWMPSTGIPQDSCAGRARILCGTRAVPVTCLMFPHITPPFPSRGLHGRVGGGHAFSFHYLNIDPRIRAVFFCELRLTNLPGPCA
jgi:hypothetical protein